MSCRGVQLKDVLFIKIVLGVKIVDEMVNFETKINVSRNSSSKVLSK